jgi:asparagine synthase (glutamine-hydrolysing)
MCGIVGIREFAEGSSHSALLRSVRNMASTLRHRGPDGVGEWADEEAGIAFGHTRLAIIDLSSSGNQPMTSTDGRFVVVFNGEIYNHLELRQELASMGMHFRGHSDTEVLVDAVSVWGVEGTLPRLNGMFAAALWDRENRELTLCRDPFGQKPLYWGIFGRALVFGSEIKAVRRYPAVSCEIDRDALAAYMAVGYVPTPRSIFKGLSKLSPGTLLSIRQDGTVREIRYFDLDRLAVPPRPGEVGVGELKDQLRTLLGASVKRHTVSDVPVGTLLSGGVDSSLIAAIAQSQSAKKIKSFTACFEETTHNEADFAAGVAHHLGTDHTEMRIETKAVRELLPRIPEIYDEPFADSSQVPTTLISMLVRRHVKVALSGDAADELFGGYQRYAAASLAWKIRFMPRPLRKIAARAFRTLGSTRWEGTLNCLPPFGSLTASSTNLLKGARLMEADSFASVYRTMHLHWPSEEAVVIGGSEVAHALRGDFLCPPGLDQLTQMQYLDQCSYLPDDILVKVDRASMASGLEMRVPYLDMSVAKFSWSLPRHAKIRWTTGKWLLRQLLYEYVPRPLVDRPKHGFVAPVGAWLAGPLRSWAEDLLAPATLAADGYLAVEPVRRQWRAFLAGNRGGEHMLWTVLTFLQWRHRYSGTACDEL